MEIRMLKLFLHDMGWKNAPLASDEIYEAKIATTNLPPRHHTTKALLPFLKVGSMCTSDLLIQRFRVLQARVRNWSTLTAQVWVAMIWVASKTMISAYVRTNIASQYTAPQ